MTRGSRSHPHCFQNENNERAVKESSGIESGISKDREGVREGVRKRFDSLR